MPPLYASAWSSGFGTLYTALYRPLDRSLELIWPDAILRFSIDNFVEVHQTLDFVSGARQLA